MFSSKISKTDIVQNTGQSTTSVMSQKAVSDELSEVDGKVNGVVEDEKSFEDAIRDQVNNYKPIVIEGNVTNAADEEDITSENGLLKLKDRSALNGMGYVILRKGKTFAEQITKENTIYEIRYDFDLNGEEVNIFSNCLLKFKGGKIKNGTIKGRLNIISDDDDILENISINGSFKNSVNYSWIRNSPFIIEYLRHSRTVVNVYDITLTEDLDFTGLHINHKGVIYLNNYNLLIGGGSTNNLLGDLSEFKSHNEQLFDTIKISKYSSQGGGVVQVRGLSSTTLSINYIVAELQLICTSKQSYIGYNIFNFATASQIRCLAEDNVTSGWINTNVFNIGRSTKFIVEDSVYMFDHNVINGGAFEGNYNIILNKGTNSIFKYPRLENTINNIKYYIYLGKPTSNNTIVTTTRYRVNFDNKGTNNSFVNLGYYLTDTIWSDCVSVKDIEIKKNIFPGFIKTEDGIALTQSKDISINGGIIYETPYIELDHHNDTFFEVLSNCRKNHSHPICVKYVLFNEDLDRVIPKLNTDREQPVGIITTSMDAFKRGTEGTYVNTNSFGINGDKDCIYNRKTILKISSIAFYLDEAIENIMNTVKYVKFYIVSRKYTYASTNTTWDTSIGEYLSIFTKVYKVKESEYPELLYKDVYPK